MKRYLFPAFRFCICAALLGFATSNHLFAETNSLPAVSIRAVDPNASESGDPGQFMISRNNATNAPLLVYFNITGSAINGVDYSAITNSAEIPAGLSNAFVTITPIDDAILEGTESVTMAVRQPSNSTAYYYQIVSPSSATVYISDNESNQPPTVSLVNPTNGATFVAPVNIPLVAEASDADGKIARVDFLRGTNLIGYTTHSNLDGTFSFIWSNAPAGEFTLTARAVDNFEARTTSAPVNITITGQTNNDIPVITVTAPDAEASEPGSNNGTFSLHRSGNTNVSLNVYCVYSGSASNGQDYTELPSLVNIPAGVREVNLTLHPLDDPKVEGTETATLSLAFSPAAPPVNYLIGSPSSATITILDNDTDASNAPPSVHIFAPTNGATFTAPARIGIYAEASDVDDWIATVEFFAGTNKIGTATNCPACATPINPFYISWSNVPPGNYVLTAKANDNRGASTISDPVNIIVQEGPTNPTVKIMATDSGASEGGWSTTPGAITNNPGLFTISRNGYTNSDLEVFYDIGGTASNGVDYNAISNSAVIPAGALGVTVLIVPIDDSLIEGTESVILNLQTNANYLLGESHTVTVSIEDNDHTNQPPPPPPPPAVNVHITEPSNNAIFLAPTNLVISADATSSNGPIVRVDFFYGDHLIGTTTNTPFSITWSNLWPGLFKLSAKATDSTGAFAFSPPVSITVKSAYELSFVKRQLPLWYVPGVKLLVRLYATPRTNMTNWTAEDLPPTNWTVGVVTEGGAFDPIDGKVKFGPFSNNIVRTLAYEVTPPSNESGEKHFVGTATANGASSPIAGQSGIVRAPTHPADDGPANWNMAANEVDAYSNAWKNCLRWTNGPNPIPVSYLTRAGYLFLSGGDYTLSTNYPTPFPPLLWIPLTGDSGICLPATATTAGLRDAPYVTNSCGSAVSALPTNYFSGVPFTVSITVTPPSNSLAYAVEDRPPLGFTVTNISDGGHFCHETRTVKWGIFLDNTPRVLTYDVTPNTNTIGTAYFAGVASFDGHNIPITGQRVTKYGGGTTPAVLQSISTLDNGDRLITFTGTPGACYIIEVSSDLQLWTPVEQLLNNDGVLRFTDTGAGSFDNHFYRAVPMQ